MSTVEQIEADRLLAEAIARGEEVSGPEPALQVYTRAEEPVAPTAPVTPVKRGFFSSFSRRGHSTSPERYSQGNSVDQLDELESSMAPVEQMSGENRNDDAFLARAMQMMEFEMEHDMRRDDELADDFNNKEFRGSSCKSQLLTVSTFLVIVQIAILWAMIEVDGLASNSVNPMYGPKPETLVKWGAKEAALIKYRKEYWRLVSPIMLHAGIIHMVTNGIIQLRIGGYLNIVWGTPKFLLIYLLSGMFGNVASCIFLPDTIGVGASGSLLGILSAWLVWIIFRWKKIPENNRTQRNCQLLIVTVAIAVTLATSFAEFVDYGAHFGGAIQGALLGIFFLANELDNVTNRYILRAMTTIVILTSWFVGLYWIAYKIHPSKEFFDIYDENDW